MLHLPVSQMSGFTRIECDMFFCVPHLIGAGVAQLVRARPSELEVPASILGDSNVCFDFLLICVALALNTLKTEQ